MTNLSKLASKIKILALDVDGVLTEGNLTFSQDGVEYKTFNVKDGQGIVCLKNAGFITAIISARYSGCVEHRGKTLGIEEVHQGVKFKLEVLEDILKRHNLTFENVAYMGDDLPDICILEKVGLACCPNDAVDEVRNTAKFISKFNGGKGAVREVCNLILRSQNIEPLDVVKKAQK